MSNYEAVKRCMDKRLENGLCSRCGKNPIEPGKSCCKSCLDKHSKHITYVRKERLENGICPICGKNPLADNRKMCKSCLDKHSKYERMKREKRNGQNNRVVVSGR